ncbi:NAD-dependent epimerase/dehydratase family protein [Rhizobium leguminosarum]|uniref:NAD-dependent epimerase/dehydratase family protein n=1 Tax=Rhizobium leguminosarum TaxID=384 RepID=UPI0004777E6C|nr:NAD-dependent epimerase/dehydratase family protein [Rhizobium leguminosarum]MBY2932324.1 NAD-dependent epimerase/dehydratase family protein [Rhizobium leguminosarum]MBY3031430.1 NAD-dependent epimerase/dehydratase family protein [Rhizobium leguminosarum]
MSITSDNSNDATVLVTGIGGFLAGHIALQLLKQGYRVRGSLRSIGTSAAIVGRLGAHTDGQLENLSLVQADLDSDGGWAAAVEGCDYVIHTASPFPPGYSENENALIQTARDGALRVLREAHRARVKRVVLTSSIAATNHGDGRAPFTEENWTDPESPRATPYYKSKTLDLAVINPSVILGPLLGPNFGTSVGLIHHLMTGRFNGIPRFGFSVVDVRDTADAHIRAMTDPAAGGQRFIIGGRFFWLKDLVAILAHSFPDHASRLPSGEVSDEIVRVMAQSDPDARTIVHELNRDLSVSAAKAHRVLGWRSRPEEQCIRASAQSLIDLGLVPA